MEDQPGGRIKQEDTERGSEEISKKLPQFLAGSIANIIAICLGTILGWTSSSLRHLEEPDTPITITTDENSWISSLMPLTAAFGPFAAGYVAQKLGRRNGLLIASVPVILSYICLAVADAVWVLYLGRLIAGIAIGWTFTVLPMYTSEVSESQYRGGLGTILQFAISIGLLFDYAIGPYAPFMWLSIASLVFPVLFLVCFFFMPESPYFLLQKGRDADASKALQWLRGKSAAGVATELKIIKTEVEEAAQQSGGLKEMFRVKTNVKAVGLCVGLVFFQQFSGVNVVLFNAESIFKQAGGSITPDVATIIVGAVMLLAAFPTPVLVEKLGRRALLLTSAIGMCISLAILGLCFYLDENGSDTSSFSFLPVVSVLAFLIFYSPGFGPLPWAVMGEMYPSNIKALGSTLTASAAWLFSFLVTRFFNDLVLAIKMGATFWIFGGCCAVGACFVFFFLPETKNKTVAQIHAELRSMRGIQIAVACMKKKVLDIDPRVC